MTERATNSKSVVPTTVAKSREQFQDAFVHNFRRQQQTMIAHMVAGLMRDNGLATVSEDGSYTTVGEADDE